MAIARVLASNPEVLLCDEATSALDPQTTKSILALLKEINERLHITIVLITHEMSVVQEICNHVLVLEHGKLVEEGAVDELFHAPKTEATKKLLVQQGTTIKKMEGGKCIRLSFTEFSVKEPVIANCIITFKTPLNILFADMKNIDGKVKGQMILQLPENESIANEMIAYFEDRHLGVEEWKQDVE